MKSRFAKYANGGKLTIVVEGMGRINFGRAIKDYKGIVGNVTITSQSHTEKSL